MYFVYLKFKLPKFTHSEKIIPLGLSVLNKVWLREHTIIIIIFIVIVIIKLPSTDLDGVYPPSLLPKAGLIAKQALPQKENLLGGEEPVWTLPPMGV